jgi:hypothetical protein
VALGACVAEGLEELSGEGEGDIINTNKVNTIAGATKTRREYLQL